MMTLDEMKLAVCGKLPHLIIYTGNQNSDTYSLCWIGRYEVNWPTEGLQVCHEAEKLLRGKERKDYHGKLADLVGFTYDETESYSDLEHEWACCVCHATYEQRLEALCRVWWPERFN